MVAQSATFQAAVQDSRKLTSKPADNELLDLYALYKTGNGEDFSKAPKPGMFDLKGKAKYNAWSKLTEENLSPEDAQKQYVEKVEQHKKTYGYDANKAPE